MECYQTRFRLDMKIVSLGRSSQVSEMHVIQIQSSLLLLHCAKCVSALFGRK